MILINVGKMDDNENNDIERKIAIDIMKTVERLRLPLVLDELTEGKGDCFPLSILSQCRRQEILIDLDYQLQSIIHHNCPTMMRKAVRDFMLSTKLPAIESFKKEYEEVVAVIDGMSWLQYWEKMTKMFEWVDYTFIQSTAWLLQHDIIIVTTSGTENNPYMTISGNLLNQDVPCSGTPIIIGCKSNAHYQSLLPMNGWMCGKLISQKELSEGPENNSKWPRRNKKTKFTDNSNSINEPSRKKEELKNNKKPMNNCFIYSYNNNSWTFKVLPDKKVKCPICRKNFRNVHHHLQRSSCIVPNLEDVREQLDKFILDKFELLRGFV